MLTKLEKRYLYLLNRHGGRANHTRLTAATSRFKRKERERALASLEALELISSARDVPSGKGGFGGLVYWLTPVGAQTVTSMIDSGELKAPRLSALST